MVNKHVKLMFAIQFKLLTNFSTVQGGYVSLYYIFFLDSTYPDPQPSTSQTIVSVSTKTKLQSFQLDEDNRTSQKDDISIQDLKRLAPNNLTSKLSGINLLNLIK